MKEQSGHITSKVILGYILLITIAVCSVAYIYNIVEKVAEEDEPDHQARRKVYLVTNTLSLLYESEALGQLVGMPQNEFRHFNRTLNKAHNNMDSLRTLVTDSMQLLKIDTIDILLGVSDGIPVVCLRLGRKRIRSVFIRRISRK